MYTFSSQDPQKAIPKGTFLAIAITTVTYLVMAWLAAITVIRDAPGSPHEFFGDLLNESNGTLYVEIPFTESPVTSCETVYNLTEAFPLCSLSGCNCMDNNSCDNPYSCLPTVGCLYRSAESLSALCSTGFINLTGLESCKYGTLNNFQVHDCTVQIIPFSVFDI